MQDYDIVKNNNRFSLVFRQKLIKHGGLLCKYK